MWQRASLKQRLLALALAAITLVWLGAATFTYLDAREEFDEVLDAHLAQAAALLVVQATHEIDELETEHAPLLHKYARRVAFQVWEKGQQLRLHSANAPQQPLANRERGFSDNTIDGKRWRVFSTWDESGEYLIHVAERIDVREELARDIAGNLLRPMWFSLPLLALLLWVAVLRGLRPLDKLAREVEQREPDNLVALDATSAPREVVPLIERLNRLFLRIDASMQKERRFTADAAHELRTPVAAITTHAQVPPPPPPSDRSTADAGAGRHAGPRYGGTLPAQEHRRRGDCRACAGRAGKGHAPGIAGGRRSHGARQPGTVAGAASQPARQFDAAWPVRHDGAGQHRRGAGSGLPVGERQRAGHSGAGAGQGAGAVLPAAAHTCHP